MYTTESIKIKGDKNFKENLLVVELAQAKMSRQLDYGRDQKQSYVLRADVSAVSCCYYCVNNITFQEIDWFVHLVCVWPFGRKLAIWIGGNLIIESCDCEYECCPEMTEISTVSKDGRGDFSHSGRVDFILNFNDDFFYLIFLFIKETEITMERQWEEREWDRYFCTISNILHSLCLLSIPVKIT